MGAARRYKAWLIFTCAGDFKDYAAEPVFLPEGGLEEEAYPLGCDAYHRDRRQPTPFYSTS